MLTSTRTLFVTMLAFCGISQASTIDIGLISFDFLIPGTPGVNAFNISNFTGDPGTGGFALPPDFPVFTSLSFLFSTLTLVDTTGAHVIPLGDIGSGPLIPPSSVQFPDTDLFSKATFSATLDQTSLTLFDGSTFAAASSAIEAEILPSSGNSFVAGTDFAVITVSSSEPRTFTLVSAGLGALLIWALWGRRFSQEDQGS